MPELTKMLLEEWDNVTFRKIIQVYDVQNDIIKIK